MSEEKKTGGEIIEALSAYIARSGEADLPEGTIKKAKHHILDTLGAIICGSGLKPGRLAKGFAGAAGRRSGGPGRRVPGRHHGDQRGLRHGAHGPFRRDR